MKDLPEVLTDKDHNQDICSLIAYWRKFKLDATYRRIGSILNLKPAMEMNSIYYVVLTPSGKEALFKDKT